MMSTLKKIKEMGQNFLQKIKKSLPQPSPASRPPSKFYNPRAFTGVDTQQELKDFQQKQKPTQPQVSEQDLSEVLNDVLSKPERSQSGLSPGKKK